MAQPPAAGSVTLLMAIHCHQPIGNFGFVFEEAYAKAYEPFLQTLERHPSVRLALHYSGCLLDWLQQQRPDFVQRVRRLVARGQVELLTSGYYEPILPLIPEADRQGQLAMMRAALRRLFHTEASGLWLTERVWEPGLPTTLSRAGVRYTMVDTNQFVTARPFLPPAMQVQDDAFWDLLGSYTTDDAGSSVRVFPASKRLRYWMPFQRVEQTIDFLRRLRREAPVAITFADDGEKFGLWPKTHAWVYEEGWLDHWFSALEREQEWLRTSTFCDYVEQVAPDGTVYLPNGSYEEMLEWSGGYFRNFFVKYPEANAMQQKMLRVSRQLQELTGGLQAAGRRPQATAHTPVAGSVQRAAKKRVLQDAERELYAGQCNCAYWHGVFGGLYLSHLRRAVYSHLIAAEGLARQAMRAPDAVTVSDADGDGCAEVSVHTPTMSLLIDPAEGGAVTEWCLLGPQLNLCDTLTRRQEPYHRKLHATSVSAASTPGAPVSIHDVLGVKEDHLDARVIYDDHRRTSFLDYALQGLPSLQDVVRSTWAERHLWSGGSFQAEAIDRRRRGGEDLQVAMRRAQQGGWIRKSIRVAAKQPALTCTYVLEDLQVPAVAIEFNLSLRDERYLQQPQEEHQVRSLTLQESSTKVALTLSIDPPATVFRFPIETVSESEEGLERTYQGLCLVCLWVPGRPRWEARLQWAAAHRNR